MTDSLAFNGIQSSKSVATTNSGSFEKAAGFINLWVTQANGKRTKVGAVALRGSQRGDAAILQYLRANPENIAKLVNALEIDFVDVSKQPEEVTFEL